MNNTRRQVLGGIAAFAATPALAQGAAKVAFAMPDGACDCHHHLYDRRWAYLPNAVNRPPFATLADYRRLVMQRQGFSRHVIVQPSTYGLDNRCMLDALAREGDRARGVAVVGAGITDAELRRLHAAGVRGARILMGLGDPVKLDEVEPLARRIKPLGWHMQFNLLPDQLIAQEKLLARLPVPLILDHMARVKDTASPQFAVLRRLLDGGNAWVKISGAYLYGDAPGPDYADTSRVARALVAAHPERCVWGTDWPHPDASSGRVKMPDDINLVNLFGRWVQGDALRHRILVENPEAFYGFDPKKRPKAGTTA